MNVGHPLAPTARVLTSLMVSNVNATMVIAEHCVKQVSEGFNESNGHVILKAYLPNVIRYV